MKRLALIAAGLVLAGCGGQIDGDALESEIATDADERGIVLDGVDCPSPDKQEGSTFECTVTVKGQPTPLEVIQVTDDGRVSYPDLDDIAEGPAVSDVAADKQSIDSEVKAVNNDVTALCDYATRDFRKELAGDESCAEAVLAKYDGPLLDDYELAVDGDNAAATDDTQTLTFERQKNGSWLITDLR